MPIRLAIADARRSKLGALAKLCSGQCDFETVALVTKGMRALQAIAQFRPDVLLLDSRIAAPNTLAVLRRMYRAEFHTRAILLIESEGDAVNALRLGAQGVIFRAMVPELLAECIREVHAGRKWFEPAHAVSILDQLVTQRTISELLMPRDVEVARMVGSGLSIPALARELAITVGMAYAYLRRIYEKLNLTGRGVLMKLVQDRALA